MSALEKYDYEKLLDDIKLISRSTYLLHHATPETKELQFKLAEDLITRLYRDIKEMHENAPHNGKTYGGYISDEIKDEIYGDNNKNGEG